MVRTLVSFPPLLSSSQRLFSSATQPIDDIQVGLNKQAVAIMAKNGIPTIDLYKAITGECGAVPQNQCFKKKNCFCPHCPGPGYAWLANSTIVPALEKML